MSFRAAALGFRRPGRSRAWHVNVGRQLKRRTQAAADQTRALHHAHPHVADSRHAFFRTDGHSCRYSVVMVPVLDQLPPALRNQQAGATQVRDVRADVREDSSGTSALFVVLVLSDPPGDTWPVEDLWEFRDIARAAVNKVVPDLEMPWFVEFEPENPDALDPDDEQVEIDG